jgi:hypothetical protein
MSPEQSEEIVGIVVAALQDRDLDVAMHHYDERSVLHIGDTTFTGRGEIRAALAGQLAAVDPSRHVELVTEPGPGGQVVLRWEVLDAPGGTRIAGGVDSFVVVDGVIREQRVVTHGDE